MSGADYPLPYFLDTNILVYTFDDSVPEKQTRARQLVQAALASRQIVISTQVVQEFLNVALRRFVRPMTVSEAREYLDTVLMPMCRHFPSMAFYQQALLLKEESGFSFYDSLIITAAIETGCKVLLSEDLQDGRVLRGVKIVNPFLEK